MLLRKAHLYLRLVWSHVVFWTFPTPPENYYSDLGKTYFDNSNYRKAIPFFLRSEEAHNHRDTTLTRYNSYYLGHSYFNLGLMRDPIGHFEAYFRMNSQDFAIASMIGECYSAMNNLHAALEWYLCALKLEPNLLVVRIECSRILAEFGREVEALRQLEEGKAIVQDPVERRIIESLEKKVSGDLQGAIETLKEAVSEAEPLWRSVNLIQKDDAYRMLAKFQREFGDLRNTLLTLESALEESPQDPLLMNDLVMEYADQGAQLERGLALIDRALRHQPENPRFLDTKGWILFKLGRREEAKVLLKRCLELLPDYEEAKEHYQLVIDC